MIALRKKNILHGQVCLSYKQACDCGIDVVEVNIVEVVVNCDRVECFAKYDGTQTCLDSKRAGCCRCYIARHLSS